MLTQSILTAARVELTKPAPPIPTPRVRPRGGQGPDYPSKYAADVERLYRAIIADVVHELGKKYTHPQRNPEHRLAVRLALSEYNVRISAYGPCVGSTKHKVTIGEEPVVLRFPYRQTATKAELIRRHTPDAYSELLKRHSSDSTRSRVRNKELPKALVDLRAELVVMARRACCGLTMQAREPAERAWIRDWLKAHSTTQLQTEWGVVFALLFP